MARDQLSLIIDHVLTFMTKAEVGHVNGSLGRAGISHFRDAEPFRSDWFDATHRDYLDQYLLFTDVRPKDLAKPIDVCLIAANDDDDAGFSVQRVRALKPADVRGRVRRLTPYMVDWAAIVFGSDYKGYGQRAIIGSNDGTRWNLIDKEMEDNRIGDKLVADRIGVAHSVAFTREFFWSVRLGWHGMPTVLIPTDPIGARAVFRLRDIPEGKARREALRHWVAEHWRKNRNEPTEEVKVREHLRGAARFVWNDFVCEIVPSHFDVKRAEIAAEKRAAERDEGIDRRSVA